MVTRIVCCTRVHWGGVEAASPMPKIKARTKPVARIYGEKKKKDVSGGVTTLDSWIRFLKIFW